MVTETQTKTGMRRRTRDKAAAFSLLPFICFTHSLKWVLGSHYMDGYLQFVVKKRPLAVGGCTRKCIKKRIIFVINTYI